MFELLRQDINIGDKVKLFLITGKEPEGIVVEMGENFVLLQLEDYTQNRFFDKIIGGWELIHKKNPTDNYQRIHRLSKVARELNIGITTVVAKLMEKGVILETNPNTKISNEDYDYLRSSFSDFIDEQISPELDTFIAEQINNEDKNSPLTDSQIWRLYTSLTGIKVKRHSVVSSRKRLGYENSEIRKPIDIRNDIKKVENEIKAKDLSETITVSSSEKTKSFKNYTDLKELINEKQLKEYISPNAEINRYFIQFSNGTARNDEVQEIRFKNDVIFDNELLNELNSFAKGDTIPIICNYVISNGKAYAYFMHKPDTVENLIKEFNALIGKNEFDAASQLFTILKRNIADTSLLKELNREIDISGNQNNKLFKSNIATEIKFDNNLLKSSEPNSLYENARKLRLRKQFNESEKLFLIVIEKKFQIDSAVKDLADQYREQGRLNEAIILVEKYFDDFEKKEQGYNFLYDLYTSSGELLKARKTLENYVATPFIESDQISRRRRGKAYARLGALTLKTNEIEKAELFFKKAEELYPNNKQIKNALSKINFKTRDISAIGVDDYFDENLFDSLVYGISPFLKYALENCNYEGVPLSTKEKKIYTKRTLTELRELIENTKEGRPEVRAKYYLTEAKILIDIERGDDIEFYKALAKYCNAMAKIVSSEKGPIETIREYYLNAFSIIDDWSDIVTQVSIFFESFYSNHSSIVKSDGVALEKAILSISSQIFSKSFFWDSMLELFISSKQATAKVLKIIYQNTDLRNSSLSYINTIVKHNNLNNIHKTKYIELWKEATRKRKSEKEEIESDIKSYLKLNNVEEIANMFINKGKINLPTFIHDLDINRVNSILSVCENIKQYFSQTTYEDKDFYFNNIESRYNELTNSISQYPSGFSIGSILPLSIHIVNLIREKHQETIQSSKPQIDAQVEGDSIIDEEKNCEIQVSLFNSLQCSKAAEVEIEIVDLSNEIEGIHIKEKFSENLRGGGEPLIAKFILKLNEDIIKQGASDIKIRCSYKELATDQQISFEKNISISFYDSSDFNEVLNPYAEHAKSNIVESPKMFKGRNELIKRVCDTLLTSKSKGYVIYGQKRSGKSSVLWHLENNLNQSGKAFAIYFTTGLSISQDSNLEANLYYRILTAIERKIRKLKVAGLNVPEIGRTYLKDLLANPMLVFYDRLSDIKEAFLTLDEWKEKKLVLIIDEFTYVYYQIKLGNIPTTFMQNWKAFVEDGGFSLVLSGQDTMTNFIAEFQNEFAMFKTERLTYLDPGPARELIEEPIWDEDKNRSRYTRNSVDKIIDLTACSPFYIQIICNELVRFMNSKRKPVLTPADIEEVIKMLSIGFNSLTEFDFENLLTAGDKNLDEVKPAEAKMVLKQIALQTKYIQYCRKEDVNVYGKDIDDFIVNDLLKRGVISEQPEHPYRYKIEVQLFKQWLLNHN
jgi:hypothetical protein